MQTNHRSIAFQILLLGLVGFLLFLLFSRESGSPKNNYYYVEKPVNLTPTPIRVNVPVNPPINIEFGNPIPDTLSDSLKLALFDSIAKLNDSLNAVRTYRSEIDDSLITGVMESKVRGYLLEQDFEYEIKPFVIKDSIPIPEYVSFYGTGAINNNLKPFVGVQVENNKWLYSVEYSPSMLNTTQQIQFGIGRRIFRIKKK